MVNSKRKVVQKKLEKSEHVKFKICDKFKDVSSRTKSRETTEAADFNLRRIVCHQCTLGKSLQGTSTQKYHKIAI